MEDHDVIVECAKYVLDAARDDVGQVSNTTTFRSKSALELAMAIGMFCYDENQVVKKLLVFILRVSSHFSDASQQVVGKTIASDLVLTYNEVEWSPSSHCGLNTPPPPESTPTSIPHTPIQQVSTICLTSLCKVCVI